MAVATGEYIVMETNQIIPTTIHMNPNKPWHEETGNRKNNTQQQQPHRKTIMQARTATSRQRHQRTKVQRNARTHAITG